MHHHDMNAARLLLGLLVLLFIIDRNIANSTSPANERFWERTGCHKVGHVRKIRIPSCIEFEIRTNACRGYCLSYSMPSTKEALSINPKQILTSVSQCCTIQETEDVVAKIMCEDGIRNFTFKSAKTCSCFHCKKE